MREGRKQVISGYHPSRPRIYSTSDYASMSSLAIQLPSNASYLFPLPRLKQLCDFICCSGKKKQICV